MKRILFFFTAVTLTVLFANCSSTAHHRSDLKVEPELFQHTSESNRRVTNPFYSITAKSEKEIEVRKSTTGEVQFVHLDGALKNLSLCPSCPYASLLMESPQGVTNNLFDIRSGELVRNFGPQEYLWSSSGMYTAFGWHDHIVVIRTEHFEDYLGAPNEEARDKLEYRSVRLKKAGQNFSLLGFNDDSALLFHLGCCDSPQVLALDLEEIHLFNLPCKGKECFDKDELCENYTLIKSSTEHYASPQLFELKP